MTMISFPEAFAYRKKLKNWCWINVSKMWEEWSQDMQTATINNNLYSDKINLQIILEAKERACLDALEDICMSHRYTKSILFWIWLIYCQWHKSLLGSLCKWEIVHKAWIKREKFCSRELFSLCQTCRKETVNRIQVWKIYDN